VTVRGLRPRSLLLAATLASLFALAAAASALAQEYVAEVCTKNADSGITFSTDPGGSGFINENVCHSPAGAISQRISSAAPVGGVQWTLNAPAGTTIHSLEISDLETTASWNTDVNWTLKRANGTTLAIIAGPGVPTGGGRLFPSVDSASVTGRLACDTSPCNGAKAGALINLYGIVAHLEDPSPPAATVGAGATSAPLRGLADVPYRATDLGGGVFGTGLMVDGVQQTVFAHENGGQCHPPFHSVVPCLPEIDATLPLDTTALSEGPHQVRVVAIDAAGQRTESAPVTVTVRNSPSATAGPALSGTAKAGATLSASTGTWDGAPTAFSFQWLRCAGTASANDTSSCQELPGQTAAQYALTAADRGQRLIARVAATNSFGGGIALSAPSAIVAGADGGGPEGSAGPSLTGLKLSRKRFRVGKGTVLRFASSEAATLTIALERLRPGRRPARAGKLTRPVKAGAGRVAFSGRLGRRSLRPGVYRMAVSARNAAGASSATARLPFTVLPR
jgi:hypothetical protein